jgi:type II secretory pathway component PulF
MQMTIQHERKSSPQLALERARLQTNHLYFKRVILSLQQDLEGGSSFSQSLKKFPHLKIGRTAFH